MPSRRRSSVTNRTITDPTQIGHTANKLNTKIDTTCRKSTSKNIKRLSSIVHDAPVTVQRGNNRKTRRQQSSEVSPSVNNNNNNANLVSNINVHSVMIKDSCSKKLIYDSISNHSHHVHTDSDVCGDVSSSVRGVDVAATPKSSQTDSCESACVYCACMAQVVDPSFLFEQFISAELYHARDFPELCLSDTEIERLCDS